MQSFDILMVIGGYDGQFLDDVELVDLADAGNSCGKTAPYPYPVADSVGFWFQNQPWVCGGEGSTSDRYKECYAYDANADEWTLKTSMATARAFAAKTTVKNGDELWISGGKDDNNNLLRSVEVLQSDGTFTSGPDLPEPIAQHCIEGVDDNRVFVSGGDVVGDNVGNKKAYMYSFVSQTWDSLPPMLEDRFGHTCQVMSPDADRGVEIVASGGWQSRDSEIFQLNVDTWRLGPFFDDNKYLSNSVAYNETFVLSGGYGSFAHSDDIWKFENSNITWKKLTQALVKARTSAAAMLVPKSFCKAS